MPPGRNVLIVEDNDDQRAMLAVAVADWQYRVETAADGQEALEKLDAFPAQVIVTDLAMPRLDGAELLRKLAERGGAPPVIVMTAYGDIQKAVSVVHDLGAFWFLEKPFEFEALRVLLERAATHGTLVEERERLQRRLAHSGVLGDLVGCSPAMRRVFALVQQVAPTSACVLISGPSGSGKEMVASTIHRLSPRANGPFVAINCAALPESLMESELFGHEKGAFTGAVERRAGCFELAQGGTLLLDEIGEMRPATQAKLLRVLEDGQLRRLGGKAELQVNVRVLAATNKVPEVAISKHELRQDLFYRLNVFRIDLPPLSERKEDIPLLAEALLADLNKKHGREVSGLAPAALERLLHHNWPGNVRELRNTLERAVIVAGRGAIGPAHLSMDLPVIVTEHPQGHQAPAWLPHNGDPISFRVGVTVAEAEKCLIMRTLEHAHNNKTRAADVLGISLKTLHNKLKGYRLRAGARGAAQDPAA